MKLRTIAIDDEPLALQLLSKYIDQTPFLEKVALFDNPISAMQYLEEEPVELIFSDIQMPDLSGTDFARLIKSRGYKLVFTTAHEAYALEGFKLDALDYLLKPFDYTEFLTAAQKARRMVEMEHKSAESTKLEANNEFMFLKSEYKIRRINFNNILYIEGLKDYIKVYTTHESKPILSLSSLKSVVDKLPHDKFMRVHRSFIVNLSRIETIERFRIVFGEVYIPVGEQYKEQFQVFLNENFL